MPAAADWNSLLFVPGSRPDRFAKALASPADLVCIDLEDAVAAEDKGQARSAALEALARQDVARLAVRINALTTAEGLRDLLALRDCARKPAALLVPMAGSPSDIAIVRQVLDAPGLVLVPLIESAAALASARDIALAPGVGAMMFGGGDLSAQLGVELAWEPLYVARAQFILACAGLDLTLIDVPFVDLGDEAGLEEEARRAKALGFTGKAAIHPGQIPAIRRAFAPSQEEVREARESLAAFREAGGRAIRHEGRLLEAPLVRRYEAVLKREESSNA